MLFVVAALRAFLQRVKVGGSCSAPKHLAGDSEWARSYGERGARNRISAPSSSITRFSQAGVTWFQSGMLAVPGTGGDNVGQNRCLSLRGYIEQEGRLRGTQ